MKNKIIRSSIQLGPLLKEIRKENNKTQVELFQQSNILPKTISALENGNTNCTIETLLIYINSCGYHLEFVENEKINIKEEEW